ncbi:hypothetical protein IWX78_002728 [Mycetocola sp. CAN_C7]|uniref:hypothetical protein n=1 Tax=Mycetocola sp. CAN_C7 TaxID=2787724 RepID=UPI0018C9BD13
MPTIEGLSTGLHTDALTDRVKRREVRDFFRSFARQHPSVRSLWSPARRVTWAVGGVAVAIGLLAMAVGISEEIDEQADDMAGELVGMSVMAALMLFGGVVMVWYFFRTRARRSTRKRQYRLARFAAQNGMTYQPGPVRGTHLTPWADRGVLVLSTIFRSRSSRFVEIANFELISGTASNRNTQVGGYCAVKLSAALPHILVQARDGRPDVVAQAIPARAQALSLEGDFDDHFTLYCPDGYERDALYLFTPDVMARLIDRVHGFDVEIVDDWLFLVSSRDVVTLDPDAWRGLFDAASALMHSVSRWERWRDDRLESAPGDGAGVSVAPPTAPAPAPAVGVAKQGQRLRTTIGPAALIGILVAGGFLAAVVVANLLP